MGQYLANAPLKEVLVELQWDLEYIPAERIFIDQGFDQAVFKFTQSCQQDYNHVVILKPDNIPPAAYAHRVTHRFHKVEGQHPLFQMGPGVFTINDNNKNYRWDEFKGMVEFGASCLRGSYQRELVLSKVEIRYIDRVPINIFGSEDMFEFAQKHLKLNISPFEFIDGEPEHIQSIQGFIVDDKSALSVLAVTGVDPLLKEDVIEWHTFVTSKKRLSWESFSPWIESAHDLCSITFNKMLSKDLYEYFS